MNKSIPQEMKDLMKLVMSLPMIVWGVGIGWVMVKFEGYMLAMREEEALKKGYLDMRPKE